MIPILGGTTFFILLFSIWRHISPSGILFYQGVASATVSAFLQLACVLLWRKFKAPFPETFFRSPWKDVIITFLFAYAFMFTIPTTVDRAYSVKLIMKLHQTPSGMTQEELSRWFLDEFAKTGGVERRVREQLATGSLAERNGRYVLTSRGHLLFYSFEFVQEMFSCGVMPAARM